MDEVSNTGKQFYIQSDSGTVNIPMPANWNDPEEIVNRATWIANMNGTTVNNISGIDGLIPRTRDPQPKPWYGYAPIDANDFNKQVFHPTQEEKIKMLEDKIIELKLEMWQTRVREVINNELVISAHVSQPDIDGRGIKHFLQLKYYRASSDKKYTGYDMFETTAYRIITIPIDEIMRNNQKDFELSDDVKSLFE